MRGCVVQAVRVVVDCCTLHLFKSRERVGGEAERERESECVCVRVCVLGGEVGSDGQMTHTSDFSWPYFVRHYYIAVK